MFFGQRLGFFGIATALFPGKESDDVVGEGVVIWQERRVAAPGAGGGRDMGTWQVWDG